MRSWEDICADKSLEDMPYKIETNRLGQIVMTQAFVWQRFFQGQIGCLLGNLMKEGGGLISAPIESTDGVKVADVAWISQERGRSHNRAITLPIAPEICVEVVLPINQPHAALAKIQLYFAQGAKELWLCDETGGWNFFHHDSKGPVSQSRLCPDFPVGDRIKRKHSPPSPRTSQSQNGNR